MPILLIIYFSAQLIGQIPATVWVLFTENRFGWNSMMVGFSLAGLGLLHSVFQAFVAGRIATKWGEKRQYCSDLLQIVVHLPFSVYI